MRRGAGDSVKISVAGLLKQHVSVGKLLMLLVFLNCTTILTFVRPLILKSITDDGMLQQNLRLIVLFAAGLLFATMLEQLVSIVQSKMFAEIQNAMSLSLYQKVFDKVLRLKKSYFTDHNSADIINRTTMDIRSVCMVADRGVLFVISYVLSIIGGVLGLFLLNWKLATAVIAIAPVKIMCAAQMAKLNQRATSQNIKLVRKFSSWFGDMINGIKEIKLWSIQDAVKEKLSAQQNKILHTQKKSTLYSSYNASIMVILDSAVQCALYVFGGVLLVDGELTLGGVMAFISYTGYVLGPITSLTSVRYMFSTIQPSLDRLNEFFSLEGNGLYKEHFCKAMPHDTKHCLEVCGLAFSYSEDPLLKNVDLKVCSGQKIAIIGQNGSGKSTLMDLLLRFEEPQSGAIFVDGIQSNEYTDKQYMDMFAVVEQEPYFFKDSVKNNVDPENRYSDAQILQVFAFCGIMSFFNERFKGDLNQQVHFDGGNLSGGERKKLAIARAVLKNAPILLMDEAAADYDCEAERYLSDIVATKLSGKIVLYITHNYSYLHLFDKVYRLIDGELKLLSKREIECLMKM